MVAPNFIHFPLTWAIVGIIVHATGFVILRFRACPVPMRDDMDPGDSRGPRRLLHVLRSSEFGLLGKAENGKIRVRWLDESVPFLAISWFHSLLCIAHVFFGTVIFSGMMFVGPLDALVVFVRFLASCLLCRIVLMFELAGLREAYDDGDVLPDLVREQVVETKGVGS